MHPDRRRRTGAVAAAALPAGLLCAPAGHSAEEPRRVVENLDHTHVEKWNPATETSARLFEPSSVVSGARNATPFYGDIVGDWREEILAETGDHTALRLYTTTEPTRTRLYTLAQNPSTASAGPVRGYLQSTYTDYHLGTETRRVPKPSITLPEGAVSHDDHA
ncbi:hypothetical protein [Streptomyces regalis]|uniref:Rhamnogalacturonan lyase family 11 C-terminal domain-containing protein n=1 Tax=Streptomyces regalis TaxID=68262 RepID=A0A0X3VIG6_9ACTN|nr:hypothetical protein [Streptomyces regalis]KUL44042.1 hypothetical protein ADL12_05700 [Streptomyces regalis]